MEHIIFWCEFPEEIDWKKLDKLLKNNNFIAKTYIACNSRKDFLQKKKLATNNIKIVGAWPTLDKGKGYWFSSFTKKKDIDLLKEFKGIDMKIDIEPPFEKHVNHSFWLTKYFLKKPKNRRYLQNTIKELSQKSSIILSTFPCPEFALKRYGFFKHENLSYNFMHYSSFIPFGLKTFYRLYYKLFMRKKDKEKTYFALGLLSKGIFGNEPTYNSIKEFRKDLSFLKKNCANNFVIFRLGSLLERKDSEAWIKEIKSI